MKDVQSISFQEIDTFEIALPFPSDIEEKAYTGNRGIGNITLSTDIKCIEPNACNSPESSGTIYTCTCSYIYTIWF